jgi:hypothetical protein
MMAAFLAVWAILAQAFIPAVHHHDGMIGGWHQQGGSNQPDQDDNDDCPICQAAHAIGTAVLLGAPSSPILVAMVFRTVLPDLPGHIDRRKTDRPRQRAPPPLI